MKDPEKGKVKTRLANDIGDKAALEVYKDLLRHTQHAIKELACSKQIYYSNRVNDNDLWNGFEKKLQQGASLGERIKTAFENGFKENYKRILIIGSDCPDIKEQHIKAAFNSLHTNDVVIGPAQDGGYYTIGMNFFYPKLFNHIDWSTHKVFQQTINTIEQLNLNYAKIETLSDIDTLDDLKGRKDYEQYVSGND